MNDRNPLVSIIVPVYGVERYLDRCVTSLVEQTYQNLEIILVDDGSPDGCPSLCDAWSERDSRITVIHQENAGVSAARNHGIDETHGEYLYFVDADDVAEPELITVLVARALADDAQIVFCGYETNQAQLDDDAMMTVDETRLHDLTFTDNASFSTRFAELAEDRYIYPSWNKLFRTDFVHEIDSRFPVGVVADEDSYFNFPLYAAVERVSVVPAHLYHYVVRSGSAAGRYQPALFPSRKMVWEFVSPIIAQWNPSFSAVFDNLFLSGVGLCLNFLYEDSHRSTEYRHEQIRSILQDKSVSGLVHEIKTIGLRNAVIALCLRSRSVILCSLYGKTVALLKQYIA